MTTINPIFASNLERIHKTIRFEKTDRPPVAPSASGFCARVAGVNMAQYCAAGPATDDIHLKCWRSFKYLIDAVHGVNFQPQVLSLLWLSKVKMAGVELPDDEMWQVEEHQLMTLEDYDEIISQGYFKWVDKFLKQHLGDPLSKIAALSAGTPLAIEKHVEAGIVPLGTGTFTIPFEPLCGARSMVAFMGDLIRRPDKVKAAMEVAGPEMLEAARQSVRRTKPYGVWLGGWRAASEMMSPKLWQEMVWPYFKKMAEMLVEEGTIPIYHLDSNWLRDLDYFKDLPKHKAIMALDGATDIFKAAKIMDGHTAILGDVPPGMLAFDEPSDVRKYTRGLIEHFGGRGLFVAPACDTPYNAKPENIAAMIEAVHEF